MKVLLAARVIYESKVLGESGFQEKIEFDGDLMRAAEAAEKNARDKLRNATIAEVILLGPAIEHRWQGKRWDYAFKVVDK